MFSGGNLTFTRVRDPEEEEAGQGTYSSAYRLFSAYKRTSCSHPPEKTGQVGR